MPAPTNLIALPAVNIGATIGRPLLCNLHFFLAEKEKNEFKKLLYGMQKEPRLAARSSLFR